MTACAHSCLVLRTLPRCAEGLAARFLLTVSVQQQITTTFSRRDNRATNHHSAVPFGALLRHGHVGPGTGPQAGP
jgi:hypothetical protein